MTSCRADIFAALPRHTRPFRGLEVYNPTTDEIRRNTTDVLACWFIDGDYIEESSFVLHAYFTGVDEHSMMLQPSLNHLTDQTSGLLPS